MLMSSLEPLPFEIAPVDEKQKSLTAIYLLPHLEDIIKILLEIRSILDPQMAKSSPSSEGKPYPLGQCLEITNAVRDALFARMRRPRSLIERRLAGFVSRGGMVRPIWGALRGKYFQNATQFGSLYVDASNDTVSILKPKVEILPIERCGLEPIRDIRHFQTIVRSYWQSEIYANYVCPSLAPIMPMISVNKYGHLDFQAPSNYMIALMMRNQFHESESWISSGPAPSARLMEAFIAYLPADLRPRPGVDARSMAITACQQARAEGRHLDMEWRRERLMDYFRFRDHALARQQA